MKTEHNQEPKPCVYLDNGNQRQLSYTKFKTEKDAREFFPGKFVYWPETNPEFYKTWDA